MTEDEPPQAFYENGVTGEFGMIDLDQFNTDVTELTAHLMVINGGKEAAMRLMKHKADSGATYAHLVATEALALIWKYALNEAMTFQLAFIGSNSSSLILAWRSIRSRPERHPQAHPTPSPSA